MINKEHPKDVGLGYFSHLKFAWCEMIRLECMAIVMFVHGVIPWVWDNKFSDYLDKAKSRVRSITREES